jgi:peroxiredoxin
VIISAFYNRALTDMTFHEKLRNIATTWRERVGPTVASLISLDIDALDGVRRQALREGATFPAFPLEDQNGRSVDLKDVLASQPALITFYRGGWCQFCSLALAEFQGVLEEARRLGVRVLAISPEKPEFAQQTIRDNQLTFDVLHDREGRLADAVGIRYEVSDIARSMMRADLAARNGDSNWRLPVPATYVVDKGGLIQFAHVDPDFRHRLDAETIRAALRRSIPQRSEPIPN